MIKQKAVLGVIGISVIVTLFIIGYAISKKDGRRELSAEEMELITSLGYADEVGRVVTDNAVGLTVFDKDRVCPGLTLIVYGASRDTVLLDNSGKILHRWNFKDYGKLNLDVNDENTLSRLYWRDVELLPDGGAIAIFDYLGIMRLTAESELMWWNENKSHHDIWINDDGSLLTLTAHKEIIPILDPEGEVVEDYLSFIDIENGVEFRRISMIDCFLNSEYRHILLNDHYLDLVISEWDRDILHTNSVFPLDETFPGNAPVFREGNILVSMRNLSALAVVDPEEERIVWAKQLDWGTFQHKASLLPGKRILFFDNSSLIFSSSRGMEASRVIEFDTVEEKVAWTYISDPPTDFFSRHAGSCCRLWNGNTFIVESEGGRIFETGTDREIVWEYITDQTDVIDGEIRKAYICEGSKYPVDYFDAEFRSKLGK